MKTNPGNFSTTIKSTTETAFQRAIFLKNPSFVEGETIDWLDIELPVDLVRKSRRKCLDLLGLSDSGYVICELKFGEDSSTDKPEDAAKEVLCYKKFIEDNYKELDAENNVHHKNGKPFLWSDVAQNSRCIIAANEAYWDYWLNHRGSKLPIGVKCYSLDVDVDCFKLQKGELESYEPTLPKCNWNLVKE